MMITGGMIRRMRTEAGISQTELAKLAGISQAHIAKIENERVDPRLSTVNKILFVLSKSKRIVLCKDIMNRHIVSAKTDTPITRIISLMKSSGISQVPIMRGRVQAGSIRESTLIRNSDRNLRALKAGDMLDKPFPTVDAEDPVEMLPPLLDFHSAVLVTERGRIRGIITKSDLLELR